MSSSGTYPASSTCWETVQWRQTHTALLHIWLWHMSVWLTDQLSVSRSHPADLSGEAGGAGLPGKVLQVSATTQPLQSLVSYSLMFACVRVCACSVSLKQSVSLLELEQQLTWIRAEVESRQPLQRYLLAADEDALADQVVRHADMHAHAHTDSDLQQLVFCSGSRTDGGRHIHHQAAEWDQRHVGQVEAPPPFTCWVGVA